MEVEAKYAVSGADLRVVAMLDHLGIYALRAAPEPERQLSKKELKKKELEDMDAVLAELGIAVATVRAACACGRAARCAPTRSR